MKITKKYTGYIDGEPVYSNSNFNMVNINLCTKMHEVCCYEEAWIEDCFGNKVKSYPNY